MIYITVLNCKAKSNNNLFVEISSTEHKFTAIGMLIALIDMLFLK